MGRQYWMRYWRSLEYKCFGERLGYGVGSRVVVFCAIADEQPIHWATSPCPRALKRYRPESRLQGTHLTKRQRACQADLRRADHGQTSRLYRIYSYMGFPASRRHLATYGLLIAFNAIPSAPPFTTLSACLNVKLNLSPLSLFQSPAFKPSSTSASPTRSILATPPGISLISSIPLSAIP